MGLILSIVIFVVALLACCCVAKRAKRGKKAINNNLGESRGVHIVIVYVEVHACMVRDHYNYADHLLEHRLVVYC